MKGLYGPFYQREAVCFYIDQEFEGVEAVSKVDESDFVVREYPLGEKLAPLVRPSGLDRHKFHRVTWKKAMDYPCISKYYRLFDDSAYSAICDDKRFKYVNRCGIKIGGWPTTVQTNQRYPGAFDMQIDMTQNFIYMDSGIGNLSSSGGTWYLMFECM